MRSLWFSSLLCLLIGCTPAAYRQLAEVEHPDQRLEPIFHNSHSAYLFKTNLTFREDNYFTGLMLLKHMPDSSHRIVFTTELGVKMFDVSLKDGDFTVHQSLGPLSRKRLMGIIESDLKLILMQDIQDPKHHKQALKSEEGQIIFKVKADKGYNYYYIDPETNNLARINKIQGVRKKIVIELTEYRNGLPQVIDIAHPKQNLYLQLKLIER